MTHSAPPPAKQPAAAQQQPAKPPPPSAAVSVNKMHAGQTDRRLLDDEIFVTAGLFRNWLFCVMTVPLVAMSNNNKQVNKHIEATIASYLLSCCPKYNFYFGSDNYWQFLIWFSNYNISKSAKWHSHCSFLNLLTLDSVTYFLFFSLSGRCSNYSDGFNVFDRGAVFFFVYVASHN